MSPNPVLNHVATQIRELQPYQPGRPISAVMRERGIRNVVKLASNENPLGAGQQALAAIHAMQSNTLALYPDGNATALRQAISRRLSVPEECIILGNGSNEILELSAHLMLHQGTAAVYSDHAFIVYKLATATRRADSHIVPTHEFAHDLTAMAQAAQADNVRLMFVANPNNPTGTWHPAAKIRQLLEQTPPQVLVVLDEAYCEYTPGADATLALLADFPNLLITRTFSKIHGIAGLRAGYAIADAEVVQMFNRIRQPFNMNVAAQIAAEAALGDSEHVENSIRTNAEGMELLTTALGQLEVPFIPSYGNFLTFRPKTAAADVYEKMLDNGYIIRKLHEYNMSDWLRVTIGNAEQNQQVIRLLKQFC
ncbi:MAG: histidinol-phosphate transaminase [Proteobacteria bacterium]|nr:histidinol-phosphate transaminase [Pseudomonadota bacterium]